MATDAEQRYLAAMASLGAAPYRSADVALAYGAKDQRGVPIHRDVLIQKGISWSPRRGQLDLTVPLFAEYLRDNLPIASFDDLGNTVVEHQYRTGRAAIGRYHEAELQRLSGVPEGLARDDAGEIDAFELDDLMQRSERRRSCGASASARAAARTLE